MQERKFAALVALALGVVFLPSADAEQKRHPVTRVVTLLKDMLAQLKDEADQDEEIWEKMDCWCKVNDKAKTKSVKDAEAKIADLTTTIEALTGAIARLETEIESTEEELKKNRKSLEVATALRAKQLAEFNEEEKEMLQAIQSLKAAIIVLEKHHKAMLVADKRKAKLAVAAAAQVMQHNEKVLRGKITPKQRKVLLELAKAPSSFLEADAPQYKAQSGEIFGILKQMLETFEQNLESSKADELENQKQFAELKSAKLEEIEAAVAQIDQKKQQLADSLEKKAQSEEDLEDTQAILDADTKFLIMLKKKCAESDEEWGKRKELRAEEMAAVSEAIAILTDDAARDTFSKTFNAEFVQLTLEPGRARRDEAAEVLARTAKKTGSAALGLLATSARLDHFTKVKEAIDEMVESLLKEKEDEIKHKDFCVEGLNKNELETAATEHEKESTAAKVTGLKDDIKTIEAEMKELKAEVAEMKVQLKRAGEDRELEHKDYLSVVADQKQTQAVLKKAVKVLEKVYGDTVPGFVQVRRKQPDAVGAPPPEGFSEQKGAKDASTGVLLILQNIIAEAKELQAATEHDEQESQKGYEDFVRNTNDSMEDKKKRLIDMGEDKAKKEKLLTDVASALDGLNTELEDLSGQATDYHSQCDFYLKNFEIRQESRDEEIEALKTAKSILSGMKLPE